jgi:uncharacterized membrane protein YhaH (DUF805 family)
MYWYLKVLKQYSDFNGRARRTEIWMFTFFNMIFMIVAVFVWFISSSSLETLSLIPAAIYILAMIIPSLAVTVRRLHDVGKSEWMCLISLIPIIGPIWILILLCTDSDSEENNWGANPKI